MSEPPIHPKTRIGHGHLMVSDLDRAVAFYRDVLERFSKRMSHFAGEG
jgi:predicted enzyme related to lactoylglutathione lyase